MIRREYKSGTKYCIWRWKEIFWQGELYLTRLHIFQCPLFSIMLHWIHTPDLQRHLHDHPVSMLCFILWGSYLEVYDPYQGKLKPQWVDSEWRSFFNWIPANKVHRIVEISKSPVITLCFAGRRKREWGFYTENGWVHWRLYQQFYDDDNGVDYSERCGVHGTL